MALSAEAAGRAHKPFVVLDRPDPIRGDVVQGGVLDTAFRSFVGQFPVAMRYGLTPGELMRWLVGTGRVSVELHVIPMEGWRRGMWWDATGTPWQNPSPNLRAMDALALYPGTVFFEGTNLSEGRGTDEPFRLVGAGWLTDAGAIAQALNALHLPGVRFDSTSRTIAAGQKWGGKTIPMIEVIVTDRDRIHPVSVGVHLLRAIYARHQRDWQWKTSHIDRLAGTDALRKAVEDGSIEPLLAQWDREAEQFAKSIKPYLLYR
jgi:uncharacterized protein YbbC (DUF1343 family)